MVNLSRLRKRRSDGSMADSQINEHETIDKSKKDNHRGQTVLTSLWNLEDEKIMVDWNDEEQPIDAEGGLLGQFLGTVARKGSLCPLNFNDWKKMPKIYKEYMLESVKSKFDLGREDHSRWILESINTKWRNWKSDLKARYFDADKPQEEILKNVPRAVNADQWTSLVQFWYSEEGKSRSTRNKDNCKNQGPPHTAGQKSFARIRHEKLKETGVQLDRAGLYIITHEHADGRPVDEIAEKTIEKIKKKKAELDASQGNGQSNDWDTDIFSQVLKKDKRRRIQGLGLGARFASKENRKEDDPEQVAFLKNKVNMLEAQVTKILSVVKQSNPSCLIEDFSSEEQEITLLGAMMHLVLMKDN